MNTLEEFRPFESLLFVRLFNLEIFKNTQYLIFVLFFIFNFQYDKSSVNFSPHLFISFTECNTKEYIYIKCQIDINIVHVQQ